MGTNNKSKKKQNDIDWLVKIAMTRNGYLVALNNFDDNDKWDLYSIEEQESPAYTVFDITAGSNSKTQLDALVRVMDIIIEELGVINSSREKWHLVTKVMRNKTDYDLDDKEKSKRYWSDVMKYNACDYDIPFECPVCEHDSVVKKYEYKDEADEFGEYDLWFECLHCGSKWELNKNI